MVLGWRIWYPDGSTYSREDGPPENAPGYGVQAIAQPDRTEGAGNVSYLVLARFDWFYWRLDEQMWAGAMGDGAMWDLILHREPIVGVCAGRRIPTVRYEAILEEAHKWATEMGLRVKDGFRLEENRR